jgi:hypothetical protein
MAVADKTYSFRAPSDLAKRMRDARAALPTLLTTPEESDHFGWEFELALMRRLRHLPETSGQAAFARAVIEVLVETTERIQREPELMEQMRAFDREDTEGEEWRRGALRLTAERIATEGD